MAQASNRRLLARLPIQPHAQGQPCLVRQALAANREPVRCDAAWVASVPCRHGRGANQTEAICQ